MNVTLPLLCKETSEMEHRSQFDEKAPTKSTTLATGRGRSLVKWGKKLSSALVAIVAILVSLLVAPASADAGPVTTGAVTRNCSWGSCSWYVSRSATKELHERATIIKAGGGGAAATFCGAVAVASLPIAPVTGPACLGVMAVNGAWAMNTLEDASVRHGSKGACFKVTKPHVANVLYFSTNNGKHCQN